MCEITDQAHHAIMLMTGARKPECCPECDEGELYRSLTFNRDDVEYSDGHIEEGYLDYCFSDIRCNECEYTKEY